MLHEANSKGEEMDQKKGDQKGEHIKECAVTMCGEVKKLVKVCKSNHYVCRSCLHLAFSAQEDSIPGIDSCPLCKDTSILDEWGVLLREFGEKISDLKEKEQRALILQLKTEDSLIASNKLIDAFIHNRRCDEFLELGMM